MIIDLGFYTGIMFGVRSFEPTEEAPYQEFQLFIPFLYIAFMFNPTNE